MMMMMMMVMMMMLAIIYQFILNFFTPNRLHFYSASAQLAVQSPVLATVGKETSSDRS